MIQTYIFTGCFCSYRIARKIEIKTTSRSDSLRLLTQTLGPKHIKATKKTAPPPKKNRRRERFFRFLCCFRWVFSRAPKHHRFFFVPCRRWLYWFSGVQSDVGTSTPSGLFVSHWKIIPGETSPHRMVGKATKYGRNRWMMMDAYIRYS